MDGKKSDAPVQATQSELWSQLIERTGPGLPLPVQIGQACCIVCLNQEDSGVETRKPGEPGTLQWLSGD